MSVVAPPSGLVELNQWLVENGFETPSEGFVFGLLVGALFYALFLD